MPNSSTIVNRAMSGVAPDKKRGLFVTRLTHGLAVATATATLLLIVMGGTVTTTRSGDTEPTWSLRFWEWFQPFGTFTGGHLYEMSHRQLGTIVGCLVMALVFMLWRTERRKWVRAMGYAALFMVIVQGLLGGLRVLVVSNPDVQGAAMGLTNIDNAQFLRALIAMIHGTLAPGIFALMAGIMVATSERWARTGCVANTACVAAIRKLSVITAAVLLLQIALGTILRHVGWHVPAVVIHAGGAFFVAYFTVLIAFKAGGLAYEEAAAVRRPAVMLAILVQIQIFLGVFSYAVPVALPVRTVHQVMGSALLALMVILLLRVFNMLRTTTHGQMKLL